MATTVPAAAREARRWRCPSCGRAFARRGQQHSCRVVALEDHLPADHPRRPLFDHLLDEVHGRVGPCEVLPLPCCIHLVGLHDFLAVLPRRVRLELHVALDRQEDDPRIAEATRISARSTMHRLGIHSADDVDDELIGWLQEAYGRDG